MLNIKELDLPELEAADVRDEYIYYESDSSDFRFQMAEDEAFYLGQQLTDAQKQYLNSVYMYTQITRQIKD